MLSKTLLVVATLSPAVFASCSTASCAGQDETSLLQLGSVVTPARGRTTPDDLDAGNAVKEAIAADRAAVETVRKVRRGDYDKAAEEVKEAKEAAEAHGIKAAQADRAAYLGRKAGTIEGSDIAWHAWADYAKKIAAEHGAAALKARAAATAAKDEEAIEGPEGLKNRMTDVAADWSKLHYDRIEAAKQAEIDKDSRPASLGIPQTITDASAAGPDGATPIGNEFQASAGLANPPFQKALAGEGLIQIPNEADDWSTPVHDLDAITDSTPDHLDNGQVMDAFERNAKKVKDEIESKAAHRIDFTNEQRISRKTSDSKASAAVAAEEKSYEEAEAADEMEVEKTADTRKKIVDAAAARVKAAKEAAEAHAIKDAQASYAATLGREIGTIEGSDAATHAWSDYSSMVAAEKKAADLKAARASIATHEADVEKAVKADTDAMAAADESWVKSSESAARLGKASSAAEAAEAEEAIEGPEGLKNRMAGVTADWAVKSFSRSTDADQADIDGDAKGSVGIGQSYVDDAAAN